MSAGGWGLNAQVNECFKHYKEFVSCLDKYPDSPKRCALIRDDYMECYHHKSELLRFKDIQAEHDKKISAKSLKSDKDH